MTIDALPIRALRVVVAVVELGGFAAAGRQLDLPRAAISRIVGQVEAQAGTRLFRRNTRKVVPTEAGEALARAARQALDEIDSALEPFNGDDGALSGLVRMSVSHAFGRRFVLPAVASFRARHPEVHVEVLLEDRLDDMVEAAIDLTVRLGPLPDGDLVVRRVGSIAVGLFAPPSLAAALEHPVTIETLARLPAVGFRVPGTGKVMAWPIRHQGPITPTPVVTSGSIEAVADLAKAGQGIALLPRYLVATDVARGMLVPLCVDAVATSSDVHICFKERLFMPKRVRDFVEHLAEALAADLRTLP
jgi:DNA-binding transcriptional LysR family regulator